MHANKNSKRKNQKGHITLWTGLPPLLEWVFSLAPWLLLYLTGLNWGRLEILEKTQARQTDRKLGSGVLYARLETHNFLLLFSILIL
jgi:hypothetical protein